MAFGNVSKEDLIKICNSINEDTIIKAIENIDNTKVPQLRNSSTHFIVFNGNQYPLKYVLEVANNIVLNNTVKIGPNTQYNEDSWTAAEILQELFPHPKKFTIATPYNAMGISIVQGLRDDLIKTLEKLGLVVDNTLQAYTAIKADKNIAEIHNVQKKRARFKVVIDYDLLNDKLKKNCRRVPDSHGWKLNGECWVDSERSLINVLAKIKYIYNKQNGIIEKLPQKTLTDGEFCLKSEKSFNVRKNMPLNQILYGPPGTGKTYNTAIMINNILINNKTVENTKITKEITDETPWWQAIALTLYTKDKNRKFKVNEIENLLVDYIKLKNNNTVRNKLWEQLQKHTDFSSETVFAKNRNEPFIFDKTKDSEWYLTPKGINYIEDQLIENMEQASKNVEDNKFYSFVTFHQSYSYEEFVEGIKPSTKNGQIEYRIENGIFKKICIKANSDPDNNYVIVIDEINRGNISKIFGELITLVEEDKRICPNGLNDYDDNTLMISEESKEDNSLIVTLPYSQVKFGVPKNLYIIGTMNTSDRSIASIDIALRRRFKFIEMMPNSELVADFGCGFKEIFEKLNTKIKILIDRDHQIGHSYFIYTKYANKGIETLKEIWFSEILPLLNEYFYCDWDKLKLVIPGFIKEISIPECLKNECDEVVCEFKTANEVVDFLAALNQEKFE